MMNNSSLGGDFDALNAYLSLNNTSGGNDLLASGNSGCATMKPTLTDAKDEHQMLVARLMNDLKNIRQTQ